MKYLLTLLLLSLSLSAGLINGIALTVNEEPITLYEIDTFSQQNKISKEQATIELMRKILTRQGAKEKNIEVSDTQVTERLDLIREKNNLTKESFKQQLAIQGLTYDTLFEEIKSQMIQQQFIGSLTQEKITQPSEKEKKEYYQLHKKEFGMPSIIKVTEYLSSNQNSLYSIQRSPLFSPADVQRQEKSINPSQIDPRLAQMLISSKVESYTKVFPLTQTHFAMYYIKSMSNFTIPSYEAISSQLAKAIQEQQRTELLNNFFADAIRKAHIDYLRIKAIPFN